MPEQNGRRTALWLLALLAAVLAIGALSMTGYVERLAYLPTRESIEAPAGAEEVWFRTEDGKRLHAWFLSARSAAGSVRGSLLVLHGNAGNVAHHLPFVEFFPAAGFDVFLFDYRSYGRSDRGRLQRKYLYRDAEAALDALLARDDVDRRRVGLYAQSLGACFGLQLMAERPELRAAIVMSAFSSWREMAASVLGGAEPGPLARTLARWLMPTGLDPIEALPRITGRPVLLIHGTRDEIVPFAHAQRLLDAAGPNVSLHAVEGGDHNGLRWHDPTLDQTMDEFFAESL